MNKPDITEHMTRMDAMMQAYDRLTSKVVNSNDTYLELDISTPFHPDQTMLIDKVDSEMILADEMGRVTARSTSTPISGVVATVNTTTANKKFKQSSSYVHTLICEGRGYLWHRNGNMLDNRRTNLETDIPWEVSLAGKEGPRMADKVTMLAKHIMRSEV